MKHFPLLRTKRLCVQLRELSIAQSIALAAMSPDQDEAARSAFFRFAVENAQGLDNPDDWTVQERTMVVAHYLASINDNNPDFSLGEGKFSDYLDASCDFPADKIELGEYGGDVWQMQQLTGRLAQAIERIHGEVSDAQGNPLKDRLFWILACMAAQLCRKEDVFPDDGELDAFLCERMRIFNHFAESDFAALLAMFLDGRERLHHLFKLDFAENGGLLVLAKGGAVLPPARFPVDACISEMARRLVGKS